MLRAFGDIIKHQFGLRATAFEQTSALNNANSRAKAASQLTSFNVFPTMCTLFVNSNITKYLFQHLKNKKKMKTTIKNNK